MHPQPESYWGNVNPIGPRGVYDEAKRYAEALTMAYHRQQGVDTAIVRIFNTYGPRMRSHDGRAIPTFVRQALENEPLTVFGDGSQTRSFCYVDDLIRGLYLLAESGEHLPVNLGNPNEFTILELAQTVIRVTDRRRARSSTRRCRSTTRRCASPTSPEPGRCSAGSRRSSSRRGCGGCCRASEGSRLGSKRLCIALVTIVLCGVAATAKPNPAQAAGGMQVGLYDPVQPLVAPDKTFPMLRQAARADHPGESRLERDRHAKRPEQPTDPDDPAYDWSTYDRAVHERGEEQDPGAVHDLRHAGLGERQARRQPRAEEDDATCATSRYAAAKRYSGSFERTDGANAPGRPQVARLERAEQPGLPAPQWQKVGKRCDPDAARNYASICTAVYAGVHSTHLSKEIVGCGATDPRGNNAPRSNRPSISPLAFLLALQAVRAERGLRRLRPPPVLRPPDRDADHEAEGARRRSRSANIGELTKLLTQLYGNKKLWITEYGYQTRPPDRSFGVTWAKQAQYLTQAYTIARKNPRITMMLWFLLRDEGRLGGWQSGLLTVGRQEEARLTTRSGACHTRTRGIATSQRGAGPNPRPRQRPTTRRPRIVGDIRSGAPFLLSRSQLRGGRPPAREHRRARLRRPRRPRPRPLRGARRRASSTTGATPIALGRALADRDRLAARSWRSSRCSSSGRRASTRSASGAGVRAGPRRRSSSSR